MLISRTRKRLWLALVSVSIAVLFSVGSVHASTIVVHITEADANRTTNALLFAKHTCQFLPDADSSTVRILFSNDGVLNAIDGIPNPENRIPTLPDDDPKTAEHLIRQLLGQEPSDPALQCEVQMAVTGSGLKRFLIDPDRLIQGIMLGGPKPPPLPPAEPPLEPTPGSEKVQVSAFVSMPEVPGESIVVVDW